MREILFKGKTNKDEWVQGVPFFEEERCYIIEDLFLCDEYACTGAENQMVIPETIGQYTGLTDKNGTKIFEDDIVKVTDDNGETNLCSCGIGYVLFYDGSWYIDEEVNDGLYDVSKIYYIEVIGNIHDNPELLRSDTE